MRRGFGWGAAILVILLLVGIGIGAYNWGLNQGLEQNGSVEVVRYVGHGFGFFPFFLFFPLFFLTLFVLKGLWWRRHWDHDHHDRGPGSDRGMRGPWERRFEDWHRQVHEGEAGSAAGAGGEPA